MNTPLLLLFAEQIPTTDGGAANHLGTETFTKTIGEMADTDAQERANPPLSEGAQLGTTTHTATSEEQDADPDALLELALGTETFTRVRAETSDADEPRQGGALWEATLL